MMKNRKKERGAYFFLLTGIINKLLHSQDGAKIENNLNEDYPTSERERVFKQ